MTYVTDHHIGWIARALDPGKMIRGVNLEDPTAFDPGVPYKCTHPDRALAAHGAGASIQALLASGA
jgi:hypothetical protein